MKKEFLTSKEQIQLIYFENSKKFIDSSSAIDIFKI